MSEEMWSDGVSKTRSALGDVTNLVGKRGHSLISTSGVKTGDDHKKNEGLRFGKKERRENIHKQIVDCVLRPHSFIEIHSSKGNAIDGTPKIPSEIKEPCPPHVRQNVDSDTTARSSRDAGLSTRSSPIRLSDRGMFDVSVETENDDRIDSEIGLDNYSKELVETSISNNNGDDVTPDDLDFNKGEYLDCSRLVASQESRSCGLERCMEQKVVGCSNTSMDSIKACSCSFCTKAAYIWSDLHYQDIKGRMAAIKKSQKEASILVQQNSSGNKEEPKRSSGKYSKLESDLTDKWRSFFLHVEDIFALESSQLESSLLTLRDLRDNCKSDLNPTDGMHSKKN